MKTPLLLTLKRLLLLFVCIYAVCIYAGCASGAQKEANTTADPGTAESLGYLWTMTDYQNMEKGETIPAWLGAYIEGGNTGVEALEQFSDRFVFVAVNLGNNYYAQRQWRDNFSTAQDFARLAAVRIENRLLLPLTGYADDEYGAFFETVIRAASDMRWNGPVREADFWIKQEFDTSALEVDDTPIEETQPIPPESYIFYILVTVEKQLFIQQLYNLFGNIKPAPPLTREQNTAVNRVQNRFLDGF